jgi:Ran GTPase-activating protein (RanGAP) involved in mRNA processing and transport
LNFLPFSDQRGKNKQKANKHPTNSKCRLRTEHAVSAEGASRIAAAIASFGTLTSLDLSRNVIGAAARNIGAAVRACPALTTLNISYNALGPDMAAEIFAAVRANPSVTCLGMAGNALGEIGALRAAEALDGTSTLCSLDLSANMIGTNGTVAIAAALRACKGLTQMDLSLNKIGADGAVAVAGLDTLQSLSISTNPIGAMAATTIVSKLARISTLSLACCDIAPGPWAAKLADAIADHPSLEKLDLHGNVLGEAGAQVIAIAFQSNASIRYLDLRRNRVSRDRANKISEWILNDRQGQKSCAATIARASLEALGRDSPLSVIAQDSFVLRSIAEITWPGTKSRNCLL